MSTSYLQRALIQETSGISNATLKDIGWNVKLVMSSDKLSNIKEPLMTLNLELETEDGIKSHLLEMNLSELKMLIESLEAANKSVLQLLS